MKYVKRILKRINIISVIMWVAALALAGIVATEIESGIILTLAALLIAVLALLAITAEARISRMREDTKIKLMELTTIARDAKEGLIAYDPGFRIVTLNPAAEEILGVSEAEVVDKYIDPSWIRKPHFAALTQVMFPSLAPNIQTITNNVWPQVIHLTLENPKLELRVSLNRILDQKNKVVGFLKLLTDETRERGIIAQKNEFITVVAHQLRSPVTSIHWTFEYLLKSCAGMNEQVKAITGEGLKATERTLKIINDLLEVAKIEEGQFGYNFQNVNIVEFLKAIAAQAETAALERGIRMKIVLPQEPHTVKIDESRLSMAIANLIDNAIKYNSRDGMVTITASVEPGEKTLRISIEDTGIGMTESNLEKVFTKFYRGEDAVSLEPNGSGLGLYITKNIIEHHGGTIGVESAFGRGTTFLFTLPLISEHEQ